MHFYCRHFVCLKKHKGVATNKSLPLTSPEDAEVFVRSDVTERQAPPQRYDRERERQRDREKE